jgi:hypothetical protein
MEIFEPACCRVSYARNVMHIFQLAGQSRAKDNLVHICSWKSNAMLLKELRVKREIKHRGKERCSIARQIQLRSNRSTCGVPFTWFI